MKKQTKQEYTSIPKSDAEMIAKIATNAAVLGKEGQMYLLGYSEGLASQVRAGRSA